MTRTLDKLGGYGLEISQPRDGYRYSIDPLLLADFCRVPENGAIADLGTGCGIIALLLCRKGAAVRVTALEFQKEMSALAVENAERNGLGDRVEVVAADIVDIRNSFPDSCFDLVVSNPPFRSPDRGRTSPRAGRDLARHETTATLHDFLAAAKYLVKPSGRICFIHLAERLGEFLHAALQMKLAPLRLRMVHGTAAAEAKQFLVELAKGRRGELKVLPPLIVRSADGSYTEEMESMHALGARRGADRAAHQPEEDVPQC